MVLVYGSLQLGFFYGILALGIYITFRIMNIPDLTTEGSFTLGLAVSAIFTLRGYPCLGILMAVVAGALAGVLTGLLHTKLKIPSVLAGILTMGGLYSVNLLVLNSSSNVSLIGSQTVFKQIREMTGGEKDPVNLVIAILFAVVSVLILSVFFKTHLGLCIRATGDNEAMVRASSIDVDGMKIVALALSNGCVALSGGLIAQYQGFADVSSGVGILVVGLASVIIGEVFIGKRGLTAGFMVSILGSIVYRFIIAGATKTHIFPAYALKLVSACIVAVALALPEIRYQMELSKKKKEARKHA